MEIAVSQSQSQSQSQCRPHYQPTDQLPPKRRSGRPQSRTCPQQFPKEREVPKLNLPISSQAKLRFSNSMLQLYGVSEGPSRSFVSRSEPCARGPRSAEGQKRPTPFSVVLLAAQRECIQRQILLGHSTGSLISARLNREQFFQAPGEIGVGIIKKKLQSRTYHQVQVKCVKAMQSRYTRRFNSCRQLNSENSSTLKQKLHPLPVSHPQSADSLPLADEAKPRRRVVFMATKKTRHLEEGSETTNILEDTLPLPLYLNCDQGLPRAGNLLRLLTESSSGSMSARATVADKETFQEIPESISRTCLCSTTTLARVSTCAPTKSAYARYKERVKILIPSPRLYLSSSS